MLFAVLIVGSNIQMKHVYQCINFCLVLRELFEHYANRQSVPASSKESGNAMKQTFDRYACIFILLLPNSHLTHC